MKIKLHYIDSTYEHHGASAEFHCTLFICAICWLSFVECAFCLTLGSLLGCTIETTPKHKLKLILPLTHICKSCFSDPLSPF